MITRNSRSSLWLGGVLLGRITTALAASIACNTLQAPFTYTATLPCFAHPINYCVSNSRDHVAGFKPPMYHRSSFNVQRCSSRPTDRKKTRQCNALVLHMTAVNDDQSNSEGDFNSSEAEFERRLELDAQAWAGGDPGRLQWWESAKAWRRREKSEDSREGPRCLMYAPYLTCCDTCSCSMILHATNR